MATVEQLEAALEVAQNENDERRHGALLLALAEALVESGAKARARNIYEEAVDTCLEIGESPWAVEAALRLSTMDLEAADFPGAASWLERAQEAPEIDTLPASTLARLHHNLGLTRARQGSLSGAIASYRLALELWRETESGSAVSEATTLLSLGEALLLRGDPQRAAECLSEGWALHRAENTLGRREAAAVTELLGEAHLRADRPDQAVIALRKSLELWELEKEEGRCLAVNLRLVRALTEGEPTPESLSEMAELLEHYAKHVSSSREQLYGWLKLAEILEQSGELGRASVALVQAAELVPEVEPDALDRPRRLLRKAAELGVATVSETPGDDPEAWANNRQEALKLGEELYNRAMDQVGSAWCRRGQLTLLIERELWVEAATLLEAIRARDIPDEPESQAQWLAHAARLYVRAGQPAKARDAAQFALRHLEGEDSPLKEVLLGLTMALEE